MEHIEWTVPRSLDEKPQLLFLDMHQLVGMVVCIALGLVGGSLVVGLLVGSLFAKVYARMRSGRHSHFLIHMAYWHLPGWVVRLRCTPPAYRRLFIG